jgi:tRNA G18 (ribose-2'-O)-methylase SpoU
MPSVILLVHNIRSTHNVGSIFRTAEGLGVTEIIFSGYTPYPTITNDPRLPHVRNKITSQIHKTALGAETIVPFRTFETPPIDEIRLSGYRIVALEQSSHSTPLQAYVVPSKIALLIGEEVNGIDSETLKLCDEIVEIPMVGRKESFNVSVATGMALYQLLVSSV